MIGKVAWAAGRNARRLSLSRRFIMKTKILPLIALISTMAVGFPAQAADEDLTSSLYLVFDPETGEFVEEKDPDRVKQEHAAREAVSAEAEGAAASTSSSSSVSSLPLGKIGFGVAALVVLGGAVVLSQKKKKGV